MARPVVTEDDAEDPEEQHLRHVPSGVPRHQGEGQRADRDQEEDPREVVERRVIRPGLVVAVQPEQLRRYHPGRQREHEDRELHPGNALQPSPERPAAEQERERKAEEICAEQKTPHEPTAAFGPLLPPATLQQLERSARRLPAGVALRGVRSRPESAVPRSARSRRCRTVPLVGNSCARRAALSPDSSPRAG